MSVTNKRDTSAEKRDASGFSVTDERDTLACARPLSERDCHGVTVTTPRDTSSVTRDSDRPPLRCEPVTITGQVPVDRQQEHKARLAKDPRFAGWVAGDGQGNTGGEVSGKPHDVNPDSRASALGAA